MNLISTAVEEIKKPINNRSKVPSQRRDGREVYRIRRQMSVSHKGEHLYRQSVPINRTLPKSRAPENGANKRAAAISLLYSHGEVFLAVSSDAEVQPSR